MTFTVLPAVDVADGRVVRLGTGSAATATTSSDPLDRGLPIRPTAPSGSTWSTSTPLRSRLQHRTVGRLIRALDVKVELAGGIGDAATLEPRWPPSATASCRDDRARRPAWCTTILAATVTGSRWASTCVSTPGPTPRRITGSRPRRRHRLGRSLGDPHLADQAGCSRYVVTDVSKDGSSPAPTGAAPSRHSGHGHAGDRLRWRLDPRRPRRARPTRRDQTQPGGIDRRLRTRGRSVHASGGPECRLADPSDGRDPTDQPLTAALGSPAWIWPVRGTPRDHMFIR